MPTPEVYILQSRDDGRYYIGSSINLEKRLLHHSGGYTHSTHRMGEMHLVFRQKFATLSEARKIELRLKKLKRKDYIERIVKEGFIKMRV